MALIITEECTSCGACVEDCPNQAISEGDGDLPGDPYELLPVNRDDFLALASRAGIERGYAYRVYKQWTACDGT